jgi:hypothetical protein
LWFRPCARAKSKCPPIESRTKAGFHGLLGRRCGGLLDPALSETSPGPRFVAKALSRAFAADEVDAVRRQLGQVKDLAYSGQAPTVREQILEMHALGFGPCRIARETGLGRKQVARVLASGGITRQPFVPASTHLPEILELRRLGKSNFEISQALGYSRKAICRALKRAAGREPA